MKLLRLTPLLSATALLLMSNHAEAQTSPKLTISNAGATGTVIELDPTSNVEINAAGDLTVRCKLNTSGACPNVGAGAGGSTGTNPPTATLTASVTSLEVGQPLTLTWNSATADACYSSAPTSGTTGWTGVVRNKSGTLTTGASFTLTAGTHTFSIRCYNSGGSVTASSAPVVVTAATTPPAGDYCAEYFDGTPARPTHPAFTGYGLTAVEKPFSNIWGVAPGLPTSTKVGVPGSHITNASTQYLAIPFTIDNDTDDNLSVLGLNWITGTAQYSIESAAVSISISPCPGDFRAPNNSSSDPYERSICRRFQTTSGGPQIATAKAGATSGCPAPKGKKMYINIAAANMNLGNETGLPNNAANCGGSGVSCTSPIGVAMQVD